MNEDDDKKCVLCGLGKDDGLTSLALSQKTGMGICLECAKAAVEKLDFDENLAMQAMLMAMAAQEAGQRRDENGNCNCPKHIYQRLKQQRERAGADNPAQAFLAEPVSNTRH